MNRMNICLKTSRCGKPICEINGINLHSPYDPEKEAMRFVASLEVSQPPGTVILCGAGNGYLQAALHSRFPGSRLLPLYFAKEIPHLTGTISPAAWYPDGLLLLTEYLHKQLTELDLKGLLVVEWPAALQIFSLKAAEVKQTISHVLKELGGSFFTSYALGRLWIRNSFSNFLGRDRLECLSPVEIKQPIVIAGSGPSLEESVGLLKKCRSGFSLWALPSAATLLAAHKLIPDLMIMTDPGYYSIYHLQDLAAKAPAILMPLSAASGTWQLQARVAYIAQTNFFEQQLLAGLNLPLPVIPSLGTVAATALELALQKTRAQIITTGLDFCYQDIKSHGLPNTFHRFLENGSWRLDPAYSRTCKRAWQQAPEFDPGTKTRSSRSLLTYAGWFNRLEGKKTVRLFRLETSLSTRLQLPLLSTTAFEELTRSDCEGYPPLLEAVNSYPSLHERRLRAGNLLERWSALVTTELRRLERADLAPGELFAQQELTDLCYFSNLEKLNQFHYFSRLERFTEARRMGCELLETTREFLQDLQTKYFDGHDRNTGLKNGPRKVQQQPAIQAAPESICRI